MYDLKLLKTGLLYVIQYAIVQFVTFLASIWLAFVIFVLHGSHFESQGVQRHNFKIVF